MNEQDKELILLGLETFRNKKIDELKKQVNSLEHHNLVRHLGDIKYKLSEIESISNRLESEYYNTIGEEIPF